MEHDWVTPLVQAGFDPLTPSAILVEGLLVYLTEETVDRLMSTIAGIAPAGSRLLGDLAGVEMLTSPWMAPYLSKVAEFGCPWTFGVVDPEAFLSKYGWSSTVAVLGGPDANFGRWPFPPPPPQPVPGIPRSYLFSASR
jgi:methyltransferase (TIGR00027 family)